LEPELGKLAGDDAQWVSGVALGRSAEQEVQDVPGNVEVDQVLLRIALLEHEAVSGFSVLPDPGNVGLARAPEVDHHAHDRRFRHVRRGCKPNRIRFGSMSKRRETTDSWIRPPAARSAGARWVLKQVQHDEVR